MGNLTVRKWMGSPGRGCLGGPRAHRGWLPARGAGPWTLAGSRQVKPGPPDGSDPRLRRSRVVYRAASGSRAACGPAAGSGAGSGCTWRWMRRARSAPMPSSVRRRRMLTGRPVSIRDARSSCAARVSNAESGRVPNGWPAVGPGRRSRLTVGVVSGPAVPPHRVGVVRVVAVAPRGHCGRCRRPRVERAVRGHHLRVRGAGPGDQSGTCSASGRLWSGLVPVRGVRGAGRL